MAYNLREKIPGGLIGGGVLAGVVSVLFMLINGIGTKSIENRLELLRSLKTNNPTLVVDTRSYKEDYNSSRKRENFGLIGAVISSAVGCAGVYLYTTKKKS